MSMTFDARKRARSQFRLLSSVVTFYVSTPHMSNQRDYTNDLKNRMF